MDQMNKVDMLKQMLEGSPDNPNIWYLLGCEYRDQGDTVRALQAFSCALGNSDEQLRAEINKELIAMASREPAPTVNHDDLLDDVDLDAAEKVPISESPVMRPFTVIDGGKADTTQDEAEARSVTFADVGGLDDLKKTIEMKIIKPFVTPGLFERFKKKVGGGILLYGPPGCGKTFIAKATAGECGARFINVRISDILGTFNGESERNLHDIFETARAQKPAVLFFDELDALGYSRAKSTSQILRTIADQFLMEIEGVDASTDRLLIVGATNTPWDVDPAFKRPGRFDKLVFVEPPDTAAREVIFRLKLAGKPVADHIDYQALAQGTPFYSGADIENVVETATEEVISHIIASGVERPIGMEDLKNAIASSKPSTLEWLKTVKNYIRYANQSGAYNDAEAYLRRHKQL